MKNKLLIWVNVKFLIIQEIPQTKRKVNLTALLHNYNITRGLSVI